MSSHVLIAQARLDSPLGPLTAGVTARGLAGLWFDGHVHHPGVLGVPERPDHPLLQQLPNGRPLAGAVVRLAALALLVIGAAGPQRGREAVRRASQGSDVVFLIDFSASMDARDVAPSRLEEARREALGLADRLGGSRIGVIAFAGDAVRPCPLTLDQRPCASRSGASTRAR